MVKLEVFQLNFLTHLVASALIETTFEYLVLAGRQV